MNKKKKVVSDYISLGEMLKKFSRRPKIKYLWSGIKEKTFGLVFGPSKAGKTIICELLAMCLAMGRPEFLGYKLSGKPKVVLFLGLEEYWESRVERNQKQYNNCSEKERKLLEDNYLYQPIEFSKYITKPEDWESLRKIIKNSKAEVVFIDSITRMNHGNLEDSKTAEEIMQRLRDICYDLKITLFCIHHTPKMLDSAITMDKIKGSSVFSQESDFAIGVNQTSQKHRYFKTVFFRYADDSQDKVKVFNINKNIWIDFVEEDYETSILQRSDRRRDDEKREFIVKTVDNYHCKKISTQQLVKVLKTTLGIQERQIKSLLTELVKDGRIKNEERGYYTSIECVTQKDGNNGN